MQRKVIQIANSTQLISLPRKWSIEHGIKKGDSIEIEENKGNLIVYSKKGIDKGSVEADISEMDRDSLMFFIRALYKKGYDEINLTFKNPTIEHIRLKQEMRTIDVISKEVSRLTGVDIFSHNEGYCTIRSITEDSPKAFENILRRIFLLTLEILNDLKEGYETGNEDILKSIQIKHDTITTFVVYTQRILNKIGYQILQKDDVIYHILEEIDSVVDAVKFSARSLLIFKIKASKESMKILKQIIGSFDLCYHFFYDNDLKKIKEINAKRYDILTLLSKTPEKVSKKEFIIIAYVGQISEKILNLAKSSMSLHN